ncbi:hypothetical protein [Herbaspirillum sp. alder98]|uniref:hypothetical protein n=1 Tax=Herbaspirillum sp. alder98 TaxID=2913096 RepID=UPI001CD81C4E|nr:hypothetical protein [Herbaspirillum sp. alder98]MCA1323754.1 hypothetical protein [Herbaspirillum sp. alder98]
MAKSIIEILHVVSLSGVGKKTGNAYDMRFAQCIVHHINKDSGQVEPLVGELLLPKQYNDIPRGMYEVDFRLSVAQDKRIQSVVDSITPYKQKGGANASGTAAA